MWSKSGAFWACIDGGTSEHRASAPLDETRGHERNLVCLHRRQLRCAPAAQGVLHVFAKSLHERGRCGPGISPRFAERLGGGVYRKKAGGQLLTLSTVFLLLTTPLVGCKRRPRRRTLTRRRRPARPRRQRCGGWSPRSADWACSERRCPASTSHSRATSWRRAPTTAAAAAAAACAPRGSSLPTSLRAPRII